MKLRIKDNSIRMRLSQSEVERLEKEGVIRSAISFGVDSALVYSLQCSKLENMDVKFTDGEILIRIPEATVENWCKTDLVGFDSELSIDNGQALFILIEKDFKCLTDRPHEDESDLFPNPQESHQ